ncbi:hypothetical protein ACFSRY_05240 [Pontibacter locisalis]|uniref:SpoIIAA-like n=1 Tax=Pontibacter locisalis TaxID=1719035 RepID=A0ABW5IJG9_9BACT
MQREIKNTFGRTFYKIQYHEDLNVVDAVWYSSASKQDLKQAVAAGLEVHEGTRCPYRLNDNTDFSSPWTDAVAWLEEDWLPRAYKAGIRFLAHVARPDSFGEAAGEALVKGKIGSVIEVQYFSNRQDALEWLKYKQGVDLAATSRTW